MAEGIDQKQKIQLLERILKSSAFAHAQAYQELLRYLVQGSIDNNPPKEFAIATEVFHKGPDFDPSTDTIVRVYVYNLRKKLDHYYQNEGKDDKIRIDIPKGHYEINFVHHSQSTNLTFKSTFYGLIALVIVLVISNIFFIVRTRRADAPMHLQSRVWTQFLDNGTPKQIVLGDHFFFVKDSHDRDRRTIMRRDDINTSQELIDYKSRDISRRDYVQLRYPMFPKNSVWPLADLAMLLSTFQVDFQLEYASNINAADFREKDMIFIGSFHTLGAFTQTFRNSNFSYDVYPNQLSYYDADLDSTIIKFENDDPVYNHVDYGVARKIPGPNNTTLMMFTSFHETGTHGVVKYFTQPTTLSELDAALEKEFGYVPDYFEILFRASGYNRTVYTTEVEKIFQVDASSVFW